MPRKEQNKDLCQNNHSTAMLSSTEDAGPRRLLGTWSMASPNGRHATNVEYAIDVKPLIQKVEIFH